MITPEKSIPVKSDRFLRGIDVFYEQFNEVHFYIEDEGQENFYFIILKKVFPNIRLTKIFPLNGKSNVLTEARKTLGDHKRVYIVDKDFDDLLNTVVVQDNLFYLRKYSIENYLLEEHAFVDYVIDEKPRLSVREIKRRFNCRVHVRNCNRLFRELTQLYILIQYLDLDIKNTSLAAERFYTFSSTTTIRLIELIKYKNEIEQELKKKDKRYTLKGQMKFIVSTLNLKNQLACSNHIPGKYLLKYFKFFIEDTFGLSKRNIDSFTYRIAKYCEFESLDFLKENISNYINK